MSARRAAGVFLLADLVLPVALGLATTAGFAPFGYYPATLVALGLLLALWRHATAVRAAWRGLVFGSANFASGLYWVSLPVHLHGGAQAWPGVAAVAALSVYLALYPGLVGFFAGLASRLPAVLWALFFVPAAWTLAELLRSGLFTGFPWLVLGYAMTDAPVSAIVPIGGVYLVSLLMMVFAGTLWLLFAGTLGQRVVAVVIIGLAPAALWLLPAAAYWSQTLAAPITVDLIQGNIPHDRRWAPAMREPTLARYRALTERSHADLVIWPQLAIPMRAASVRGYLQSIAQSSGTRDQGVLVGVLARGESAPRRYDAALGLGKAFGRYYRHHLTPVETYSSARELLAWRGGQDRPRQRPGSVIARGPAAQPLIHFGQDYLGVLIGFEDVSGTEVLSKLPAAGILVDMTDDSAFGHSIEAAQHLQMGRMRALEAGRPLLRVANTGITAVIDYNGRVREQAEPFTIARVSDSVAPRIGTTPYSEYGNRPLWYVSIALLLIALLWLAASAWRARGQRKTAVRRRELMQRV